jgi:signal transduction histidine kinase
LIVNRTDGKKAVIDLRMIPIQTKGQTQILGIGHDITWRKQAEVQMRTYINQLENLRQIDDELTRKLDTRYVQTMALTSMMNLSGANAGSIALMGERGLSNLHSQGYPKALDEKLYLDKQPIIARVAQDQKAEWIENISNHSVYHPLLENAASQMIFPLISQHRLVGIVNLETTDTGRFTAELFDFLKLIAVRIAVAIDNAYLYESQQQQLIELQNLYEKISRLEQLKTDMIRLAAHDLRNPLTSILAKTYMLRKTIGESVSENHQRYLEGINAAVGQIQSMITDFLSVERIEEITQGVLSAQEIDLQNLVQSVINGFHVQFDEKMQTYHLTDFDTPIMVKGIKAELQQAIINIVGNAVKYTPDHGNIDISLQKHNGNVRFEVRDTGFGIPHDQQERIFQPFFRAHSDETKSIEGTGLGLYLVKRIVERSGGQILFSSEYGVGSTFGFELPLSAG